MSAALDQFQERMENHFQSLNSVRAGTGFPIFALEHGLEEPERRELKALLLESLRAHSNLSRHWLLWAIYATEQGYTYTGHEYWQSFQEDTPYWNYVDRWRLAGWFRLFQNKYEAVVPTGPWAKHFNRISWPITHAILPQYLQNHFARALWELSHRIANLPVLDARSVGHTFSLYAHGSNRFAEFLQQEELTGRIVLALLDQTAHESTDPINSITLQRLVKDLEKVRHGKEWLREARNVVKDRFVGIGRGAIPSAHHDKELIGKKYEPKPSISPNIVLRSKGNNEWTAFLDLPDFRCIAINPNIRDFLRSTRVRLSGVDGLRPAGWIIGARRQAPLEHWPTIGVPLISFERSNGVVENVVSHHCIMSKGPTWLFRIGRDGMAYEITSRVIRPGINYLLVGALAKLPAVQSWITEANLECHGIAVRRLEVPHNLTKEDQTIISTLDLQIAKTIHVWPAGLPGRAWNGDGRSEWLTTETPCLGFSSDHPIEAYSIKLNGSYETTIEAGVVGFPTFIRLPSLPAGTHQLSVQALRGNQGSYNEVISEAEGHLTLTIRDPNPWRPGRSFHSGLIVATDPVDPDLDAILENRMNLSILGPDGHHVRCTLSLKRGDGEEIFSEQIGNDVQLPLTVAAWDRHFSRFLQKHGERFVEASSGRLTINADELGEFVIPFERNILPIRWILKHNGTTVFAKLVDDTGQENREPEVYFRSFEQPLAATILSVESLRLGTDIPSPGGLLSASLDLFQDSVVISTAFTGSMFQELGIHAKFDELDRDDTDWVHVFEVIRLWEEARLAGSLLPLRRDKVIEDFKTAVFQRICGAHWIRAERQFLLHPQENQNLENLKQKVDRIPSFASILIRERSRMDGDFGQACNWFSERGGKYFTVATDLCNDALRFADDPCRLAEQKGNELNAMIRRMLGCPSILRAARLCALLSANPPGTTASKLFPRWTW